MSAEILITRPLPDPGASILEAAGFRVQMSTLSLIHI